MHLRSERRPGAPRRPDPFRPRAAVPVRRGRRGLPSRGRGSRLAAGRPRRSHGLLGPARARRGASTTSAGACASVTSSRLSSASTPSISRRSASPRAPAPAIGLADPLEHRRERPRGVEVVGEGVEEALAQRRRPGWRRPAAQACAPPRGSRSTRAAGLGQTLLVELDRLAVVAAAEVHEQRVAPVGVERLGGAGRCCRPTSTSSRCVEPEHPVVHPQPRERRAAGGTRLRGLVLVVGEDQVRAAAVDLEVDAEQLLGHRRALDVPARPARAPTASPRPCPRPACGPSTARSRAGRACARRPRRPRPGPSRRRRGATARRSAGSCATEK